RSDFTATATSGRESTPPACIWIKASRRHPGHRPVTSHGWQEGGTCPSVLYLTIEWKASSLHLVIQWTRGTVSRGRCGARWREANGRQGPEDRRAAGYAGS